MVFDAGHWNGQHCIKAVKDLITTETIDLMIISHSDADHLGDGARILSEKRVLQTILAGEPRTTGSWKDLVQALSNEVAEGGSVPQPPVGGARAGKDPTAGTSDGDARGRVVALD